MAVKFATLIICISLASVLLPKICVCISSYHFAFQVKLLNTHLRRCPQQVQLKMTLVQLQKLVCDQFIYSICQVASLQQEAQIRSMST